jgi:hypothetical protein
VGVWFLGPGVVSIYAARLLILTRL